MNKAIIPFILLILGSHSSTLAAERDCRRGRAVINLNESVDREGYIRIFQILATWPMRDSFIVELPAMDPRTGERSALRVTSFLFKDSFPNASPEMKEEVRIGMNAAADQLSQIAGVHVSCGPLPSGTHPRMGGGF